MELSGIMWSPTFDRYFLISDDVAAPHAAGAHRPILFSMSRDGVVDARPIDIDDGHELNDPESICLGPEGTFFLTTSHSVPHRRSTAPASRRRLMQLALVGGAAHLLGEVDLASALTNDPSLPSPGELDVEALAYREGSLYIGLKAPLTADGGALILELRQVAAAIQQGAIPPTNLRVWANPRLCLPSPAACEGISDMAFDRDGTLLMVANSPKGMPPDGGGALWRMEGADKIPVLLRRFRGWKPEGIAFGPSGRIAIVFDTDGAPPQWLQLSRP